jgi:hypothetical protein
MPRICNTVGTANAEFVHPKPFRFGPSPGTRPAYLTFEHYKVATLLEPAIRRWYVFYAMMRQHLRLFELEIPVEIYAITDAIIRMYKKFIVASV